MTQTGDVRFDRLQVIAYLFMSDQMAVHVIMLNDEHLLLGDDRLMVITGVGGYVAPLRI